MGVVASASLKESLDLTDLYALTQTASLALIAITLLSLALIVHLTGKWLKSSFLLWLDEAIEGTNVGSISRNSVGVAGSAYMLIQLQAMLHLWLVAATTLAVVSASFVAIAQKEMKKVVAYSSISHKGYVFPVLIGAMSLCFVASVFQTLSYRLNLAWLLLVSVINPKTVTGSLEILLGLLNPQRGLSLIASADILDRAGFIAKFLVRRGTFPGFSWQALLCMIGIRLTSVSSLRLVNSPFFRHLS